MKDKEKQNQNKADLYHKARTTITNEMECYYNMVTEIVTKANATYFPGEITSGLPYMPLYAFSIVISSQGKIYTEQEEMIQLVINGFDFPFNIGQYKSAMIYRNGIYNDFMDMAEISKEKVGRFWTEVFRAMYKAGYGESTIDKLVSYYSKVITNFAILGNANIEFSEHLIGNLEQGFKTQFVRCKNMPESDIDFIGSIPYAKHFERMYNIFYDLAERSGFRNQVEECDLIYQCFQMKTICDIVIASNEDAETKVNIIEKLVSELNIKCDFTVKQFLKSITTDGDSIQILAYDVCTCTDTELGKFWQILAAMSSNVEEEGFSLNYSREFIGFLFGLESEIIKKYPSCGYDNFAKQYTDNILNSLTKNA
jgi:hypothetical protein